MSKPHRASTLGFSSQPKARTTGGITRPYSSFSLYNNNAVGSLQLDPQDRSHSLVHKPSVSTILSSSTYTHSYTTHPTLAETNLRKQVSKKDVLKQQLKQQQKIHQKKTLPLFPTERTRGSSSIQDALRPVDIAQIELMPIEFSHKIIMSCIDEIKLRGLKHKYLFRNAFYSPSVEAALKLAMDPKKSNLFSVKMMRMDTVGGLLTTVLSRTYPPLIPPHFQDLFQNPNGRFFFELLGMLPELNRFLFVEILDLCCDLVDHQMDNCVSHSKLAIYPGSCCFGLDEYMPTWDTRYLMTKDLKKFSGAFYHVIYAYREERDLSAEELQQKLDSRDRLLQQERLSSLEQEHGLESAQAILRMEARIALGLSAESPGMAQQPILGDDMKEISLYADRQEKVVADDAISVLDIQLEDGNIVSVAPILDRVPEDVGPREEDPEMVLADLRRSVSVASLGYSSSENSSSTSRFQYSRTSLSAATTTTSFTLSSSSSSSTIASTKYSRTVRMVPVAQLSRERERERQRGLIRTKSLARFGSIAQNTYPVSPGDIFGISRHAKEQRELQEFLLIARSVKSRKRRRKNMAGKRITQWQLHNKILHRNNVHAITASQQRFHHHHHHHHHNHHHNHHHLTYQSQHSPSSRESLSYPCSHLTPCAAKSIRRDRTRQFRKGIEVYQARGISVEDATKEYQHDLKKQRRREKKARHAAEQARAMARKQADLEASALAAASAALALEKINNSSMAEDQDVTMEEAEVLEAFDYLTDQEFEQFMTLAGLTMTDVNRIRDKAAVAALNQVTKEIQATADAEIDRLAVSPPTPVENDDDKGASLKSPARPLPPRTTFKSEASSRDDQSHATAALVAIEDLEWSKKGQRPLSLPHMTSMDLLLKHTTVIGDGNLRCYPTQPLARAVNNRGTSTTTTAAAAVAMPETSYGGLLSLAATSLMTAGDKNVVTERKSEESNASSTETAVEGGVVMTTLGIMNHHTLITTTKAPSYNTTPMAPAAAAAAVMMPQERIFEFETVLDDQESDDELDFLEVDHSDIDHPIQATDSDHAEQRRKEDQDDEDEEAEELRELLESMTEEERSEFLRLSRSEELPTNVFDLGVAG